MLRETVYYATGQMEERGRSMNVNAGCRGPQERAVAGPSFGSAQQGLLLLPMVGAPRLEDHLISTRPLSGFVVVEQACETRARRA